MGTCPFWLGTAHRRQYEVYTIVELHLLELEAISRPFHEKAGFVKAAVAARRIRDLRQTFCLASIRTLLSRFRLGAC